jgi:hypothetical protein
VSTKKEPDSLHDKVVYFEAGQNRWHEKIECGVLLAQQEIEIRLLREPPEGSRPCTICASLAEPCD